MIRRPMFKREFDLKSFNERVYSFMCDNRYAMRPNVLFVDRGDYDCIRATIGPELRYMHREINMSTAVEATSPMHSQMVVMDIKVVLWNDIKEPTLAYVEGM